MTNTETELRLKLEDKLTYGRGLTPTEWDELIPLRVCHLISSGKKPRDYHLQSRNLTKKKKDSFYHLK